jgi:hypothetical protein
MQKYILIAITALAVWWLTSTPSIEAVTLPNGSYAYPGYTFSNAEPFELEARVLSVKNYGSGRESELSPTDLALGWGRMRDDDVVERIEVSQRGRWYHWRTEAYPIPHTEIQHSSANMHMVPANETVARALARVDEADQIRIVGQLVDISAGDGWRWRSSRSRTDSGNGACELILLERIDWL